MVLVKIVAVDNRVPCVFFAPSAGKGSWLNPCTLGPPCASFGPFFLEAAGVMILAVSRTGTGSSSVRFYFRISRVGLYQQLPFWFALLNWCCRACRRLAVFSLYTAVARCGEASDQRRGGGVEMFSPCTVSRNRFRLACECINVPFTVVVIFLPR